MTRAKNATLGFTLVELLVVLFIIAVITGAAVLSVGRFGGASSSKQLADRFLQVLPMAREHAAFNSIVLRMVINEDGYVFYRLNHKPFGEKEVWKQLKAPAFLKPHSFSKNLSVQLKPISDDQQIFKFLEDNFIEILPTMDITPAVIAITSDDEQDHQVFVKENGEIQLEEK